MQTNANYQHVFRQMSNLYYSRRKWIFLITLILCVVLIVLVTKYPFVKNNIIVRDTYLDNVPTDLYQTGENLLKNVLSKYIFFFKIRWYNFEHDTILNQIKFWIDNPILKIRAWFFSCWLVSSRYTMRTKLESRNWNLNFILELFKIVLLYQKK